MILLKELFSNYRKHTEKLFLQDLGHFPFKNLLVECILKLYALTGTKAEHPHRAPGERPVISPGCCPSAVGGPGGWRGDPGPLPAAGAGGGRRAPVPAAPRQRSGISAPAHAPAPKRTPSSRLRDFWISRSNNAKPEKIQ